MTRRVIVAVLALVLAAAAGCSSAKSSGTSAAVTFNGVTVQNPTDLKHQPKISSAGSSAPTTLEYHDLVVATGAAATPTATVNVRYDGVIYANGSEFDASWKSGSSPVSFPLTGVVPGFTQGIGGTSGVPAMKVGGRRIMILPPALGYPDGTPDGSIPPNTPIVFVVDLVSIG